MDPFELIVIAFVKCSNLINFLMVYVRSVKKNLTQNSSFILWAPLLFDFTDWPTMLTALSKR